MQSPLVLPQRSRRHCCANQFTDFWSQVQQSCFISCHLYYGCQGSISLILRFCGYLHSNRLALHFSTSMVCSPPPSATGSESTSMRSIRAICSGGSTPIRHCGFGLFPPGSVCATRRSVRAYSISLLLIRCFCCARR